MQIIPTKSTGSKFYSYECNNMAQEEMNLITSSGITLSGFDLTQIAKSVANYVGSADFYTCGGTANAYILSSVATMLTPTSYVDGLRVKFRPNATCTGTSTVNVASLGVKTIKQIDGATDLSAGDLLINQVAEIVFNLSNNVFELQSQTQSQGFHTGWWMFTIDTVAPPGWILYANAPQIGTFEGTAFIGDASSGANIRDNADCELLFKKIWTSSSSPSSNTICVVHGGAIGASADADWTAHRKINLPFLNGRAFGAANGLGIPAVYEGERAHTSTIPETAPHYHRGQIANGANYGRVNFMDGTINMGEYLKTLNQFNPNTGQEVVTVTPHNIIQPTTYFNAIMKL